MHTKSEEIDVRKDLFYNALRNTLQKTCLLTSLYAFTFTQFQFKGNPFRVEK